MALKTLRCLMGLVCINWFLYIFLCIYIIRCIFRKRTFKWYARKVIIHPSKKMGNSRRLYYWFWNLCLYTIHYYRKLFRLYFRFIRSWLHMANATYYMYALFNCTNIRYVLSAYANNEFQMIQFIPLVIVPQIFFSGLFPMESMNKWLQMLGKAFPLTYSADAMRQVMIRNQGFTEIALDLTVLLLFHYYLQ